MIIDIASPKPEHLPRLRRIWKEAFCDEDAFLDQFFSVGFSPDRCLCALAGDEPAAVVYWFDTTVRGRKVAYLYALATAEAYRHRGIARRLLDETHNLLRQQGYHATLLVPGDESLARWYESMGFQFCGKMKEFCCTAGKDAAQLRPMTAAEYAAVRREKLPEGSVEQDAVSFAFLGTQASFFAGDGFLLAAVVSDGASLTALEFLGDAAAAPKILAALDCQSGIFRAPGVGKSLAMFRPLSVPFMEPPTYFAFPLD